MPGTVTRTQFLAALRTLKPALVHTYEHCRSRAALRSLIEEALAEFPRLAKQRHPDQGGTDAAIIALVDARNTLRQALAQIPERDVPRAVNRGTAYETIRVTINGKPVDLGGVSIEFTSP